MDQFCDKKYCVKCGKALFSSKPWDKPLGKPEYKSNKCSLCEKMEKEEE